MVSKNFQKFSRVSTPQSSKNTYKKIPSKKRFFTKINPKNRFLIEKMHHKVFGESLKNKILSVIVPLNYKHSLFAFDPPFSSHTMFFTARLFAMFNVFNCTIAKSIFPSTICTALATIGFRKTLSSFAPSNCKFDLWRCACAKAAPKQ